jgi:hypothetical protein
MAVEIVPCLINGEHLTVLAYHTAGWSGNEAILDALLGGKAGAAIRGVLLVRMDRGGHYYFDVVSQVPFLTTRTTDDHQ